MCNVQVFFQFWKLREEVQALRSAVSRLQNPEFLKSMFLDHQKDAAADADGDGTDADGAPCKLTVYSGLEAIIAKMTSELREFQERNSNHTFHKARAQLQV